MGTLIPDAYPTNPYPGTPNGAGTYYPSHPYDSGATGLLNGLVLYYTLDEESSTRYDSIGDYDLSVGGNAAAAAGKHNNAASFPDNTSRLYTATGPSLCRSVPNDGCTIAFWVYRDTNSIANGSPLSHINASPVFKFRCGDGSVMTCDWKYNFGNLAATAAGSDVTNGAWHFVVSTWNQDHDKKARIYVDETYTDTTAAGTNEDLYTTGSNVVINVGMGNTASANPWGAAGQTAMVDQIGIWNRVLTDAERALLYNGGAGRFWPFT